MIREYLGYKKGIARDGASVTELSQRAMEREGEGWCVQFMEEWFTHTNAHIFTVYIHRYSVRLECRTLFDH